MLQEYLKLNKNVLVTFTSSITISAIIVQLLTDQVNCQHDIYDNCRLRDLFFCLCHIVLFR